jgi:hypothetical protein
MYDISVTSFVPRKALNYMHRVNTGFIGTWELYDVDALKKEPTRPFPVVDARFYLPGRSNYYCCVWISYHKVWAEGSAKVGGYGYEQESIALQRALEGAGFTFSCNFGGGGDVAVREALYSIGTFLNRRSTWTVLRSYA